MTNCAKNYLFCIFILWFILIQVNCLNLRPIIGILSQKPSSAMLEGEDKNYTSYIASSYVKFIESAGARVAPILINQEPEYYSLIAASVNGILFPGGSSSIYNDSGYGMAGQLLYQEILERNANGHYLPLWATCLGFEMLMYLASSVDLRVDCDASNIALPLITMPDYSSSALFSNMPSEVFNILTTENVTANFHIFCFTEEDIRAQGLDNDYYLLTKDNDRDNLEFLSTVEHKTLPIFATQWHPEKNSYEWKNTEKYDSIPHTPNAINAAQYIAHFFVGNARLSNQTFASERLEQEALIYGHYTKDTQNISSSFVEVYLFEG